MTSARPLTALEKLAAEVAIVAPTRRGKYSFNAAIPWSIVETIRAELEKAGVDWRALQKKMEEIAAERRDQRKKPEEA